MADETTPCTRSPVCVLDAGHEGDCSLFSAETIAAFGRLAQATTDAARRLGAAWVAFAREFLKARELTQQDYVLHPPPRKEGSDAHADDPR